MDFPKASTGLSLRGHIAIAPADRHALHATRDVWALRPAGRAFLLHLMAEAKRKEATAAFGNTWSALNDKAEDLNRLQLQELAQLLKTRHIVAATVTGATKYIAVLEQVGVKVVVVEEAAETLESLLLGCLPSTIEHMVLVGDHEQLPPSPECHDLTVHCQFDTSLPKRLIAGGLDYVTLGHQGRMRPEFVELLRPVYPDLRTNEAAVRDNAKPDCVTKSMYFWTHDVPEDTSGHNNSTRSHMNTHEAWVVLAVADAMVWSGVSASSITILCAYQGQVFLLRDMLAGKRAVPPQPRRGVTTPTSSRSRRGRKQKPVWHSDLPQVAVRTIDQFQGDEDDVVLVSLVRSNTGGQLGFLKARQRLVVAASRARNGVYFFGNRATLSHSPHWKQLLGTMEERGCVGRAFPLTCPRHPPTAGSEASTPPMKGYHDVVRLRCTEVCGTARSTCDHKCPAHCHSGDHPACDQPCRRKLKCGHPCPLTCSESCAFAGKCLVCKQAEAAARAVELAAKAAEVQEAAAAATARAEALAKQEAVVTLKPLSAEASKYRDIQRLVESSCQQDHGHFLTVVSVQAVINTRLEARWCAARARLLDPLAAQSRKFHGTNARAAECIVKDGFKLPLSEASESWGGHRLMFGRGVYFASDSSKSAQAAYTGSDCTLLVCDVLLGKQRPVVTVAYDAHDEAKRRGSEGYDSVYAMPNSHRTGGVKFDEFIVFDPDQALPRFLVKFQRRPLSALHPLAKLGTSKTTVAIDDGRMSLERGDKALEVHFRRAESQFYRMMQGQPGVTCTVVKVDALFNSKLEAAFDKAKQQARVTCEQNATIYAFHDTKEENTATIHKDGFTLDRRPHGRGVYLTTRPTTPAVHSTGDRKVLIVEAVLGRKVQVVQDHLHGHGAINRCPVMHYHPEPGTYVATSAAQVIPRFVVHYRIR